MKKLLSVLLSVLMVVTLATTNVFADDADIHTIQISNVNENIGETPTSVLPNNNVTVVNDKGNANCNSIESISYSPSDNTIQAGKEYTVTIKIGANNKFLSTGITATVNGKTANAVGNNKTATIEYKFTTPKVHNHWSEVDYSVNGNTITAKCGDSCPDNLSESISITAPTNGTYNDSPFAATVTGDIASDRLKGYKVQYFKGFDKLEGAPSNAGTYTVKLVVVDQATVPSEFTINKAKITITPDDKSILYGGDVTYSGAITPDGLLKTDPTYSSEYEKNNPEKGKVGTYEITATNAAVKDAFAENYELDYGKGILTVSKAENNCITNPTIEGWTYGDTANDPSNATFVFGTDTLQYKYSKNADDWNDIEKPTEAGTYYVKAVVNGNENYTNSQSDPVEFTIAKRPVTVSGIEAVDKLYDGKPEATLIVTENTKIYDNEKEIIGVNVLVVPGKKGTFVRADGTTPSKSAASSQKKVVIDHTALSLDSGNYKIVSVESTYAKINKAPVKLVGLTAKSKEYDGTDVAKVNTDNYHIEGAIGSDEVEVDRIANNAFKYEDGKDVGNNKTIIIASEDAIKLSGEDASNYVATVEGLKADITAKKVIVSGIEANDKEYDGTVSATLKEDKNNHIIATFTGTDGKSGICAGDKVFVTADAEFAGKKAKTDKNVKITHLELTGKDAKNYEIVVDESQSKTKATVTQKKVIISGIEAENKTYDGTTSATLVKDANDNIIATFTGKTDGKPGICGDDEVFVTADAAFVNKTAGTGKTVNISNLQLTGEDADNYTIAVNKSQSTTTADINTKEVTVNGIKAKDRVYNGTRNIELICDDAVISGKVDGDNLSVTATGKLKGKNANTNKIADITITLTGTDAANYVLATGSQTQVHGITVSPKEIKVTSGINAKNKTYDGNKIAEFDCENAVFVGVISGDVVKVSATGNFRNKNVGTRKVDITNIEIADADTTDGKNYLLAEEGNQSLSQAKITRKDVVVTAKNKTKVYSEEDPKLTVKIDGLVSGETKDLISYNISREQGEDHGKYIINVTGEKKQGNYKVTFVPGEFTIKRIGYSLELEYPDYSESSPALANKTDEPKAEFRIKNFNDYLSDTKFEYVVDDVHYSITPDSNGRIYLPATANGGVVQVKKDKNHKSNGGTTVYIDVDNEKHFITSKSAYVGSTSNTIKCDYEEYEKLAYITIDDKDYFETVDETTYYEVSQGSTDVKLLNPIMKTLGVGTHAIRFHYNNGMFVDGEFKIVYPSTPSKKDTYVAPKTGVE